MRFERQIGTVTGGAAILTISALLLALFTAAQCLRCEEVLRSIATRAITTLAASGSTLEKSQGLLVTETNPIQLRSARAASTVPAQRDTARPEPRTARMPVTGSSSAPVPLTPPVRQTEPVIGTCLYTVPTIHVPATRARFEMRTITIRTSAVDRVPQTRPVDAVSTM